MAAGCSRAPGTTSRSPASGTAPWLPGRWIRRPPAGAHRPGPPRTPVRGRSGCKFGRSPCRYRRRGRCPPARRTSHTSDAPPTDVAQRATLCSWRGSCGGTTRTPPTSDPVHPLPRRPGHRPRPDPAGRRRPQRVLRDPDPRSRVGYLRLIGYSPTAGLVITVIADPNDWSGVTAWKTTGADLHDYLNNLHDQETSR